MNKIKLIQASAWGLVFFTLLLAVIAWLRVRINGSDLTVYDVFPLLGLSAFSIMWSHYITGSIRRVYGVSPEVNEFYFKFTSTVVLALILLHPGLLYFGLFQDGFELSLASVSKVYSTNTMRLATMLGTISLLVFLAFEFKKRFWKKPWWKFVEYAQVVAMFFILFHAFTLGGELNLAWYKTVWIFYSFSLLVAVAYNYWYDHKYKREVK